MIKASSPICPQPAQEIPKYFFAKTGVRRSPASSVFGMQKVGEDEDSGLRAWIAASFKVRLCNLKPLVQRCLVWTVGAPAAVAIGLVKRCGVGRTYVH